jgi:hypothetical protein
MKATFKTSLLGFLIATALAGCSSFPTAPKDAKEMAEMGDDSFLSVPVDIRGFPWQKIEIVAKNGDKGRVTVFTDPATGKTYDLDGQPVNEKGERVLKDGYVCVVDKIMFTPKTRIYVPEGVFSAGPHFKSCVTEKQANLAHARSKWILAGAFLGGGSLALSGGAAATMAAASAGSVAIGVNTSAPMTIDEITDGDVY